MHKVYSSTFFLALFIYLFYFVVMPEYGLDYDMGCWADWCAYIFEHGLGRVYDSGTNYLPGHPYVMKLYTLFCHSKQEVISNIYFLKYVTLFFDVVGALLVSSIVSGKIEQKLILLVLMLNPAYIHNSVLWGQFDSVFSSIAFASFLSINNRRFLLGIILYVISLNFKFQAIIFFPPLIVFLFYKVTLRKDLKTILKGIFFSIMVQILILFPFILNGQTYKVFSALKGLFGEFNPISLNAANIWQLIIQGDLRWTYDWITFNGIPLKKWGLGMYAVALLIILFPLIKALYFKTKKKSVVVPLKSLLLMFALSATAFFYFNTQMHERYSYPAFLFIASFAALTEKWWLYGLFSLGYFLNNEVCLRSINKFNFESWIFDFRFISAIFFSIIVVKLLMLYFDKSLRSVKS